jgi:hypothetical protein
LREVERHQKGNTAAAVGHIKRTVANAQVTVIGKKNFMFMGSHHSAYRTAMIYSFMLSCKANGVNPEEWLMDVLEKINDTKKSELINLLPNNWKKNKITQQ